MKTRRCPYREWNDQLVEISAQLPAILISAPINRYLSRALRPLHVSRIFLSSSHVGFFENYLGIEKRDELSRHKRYSRRGWHFRWKGWCGKEIIRQTAMSRLTGENY